MKRKDTLVSDDFPADFQFDRDDATEQKFEVHLKRTVLVITPDDPRTPSDPIFTPGEPVDPSDPSSQRIQLNQVHQVNRLIRQIQVAQLGRRHQHTQRG